MKEKIIDKEIQEQIAAFLKKALRASMQSHERLMEVMEDDEKRKKISDGHKIAKDILAHVKILMELAGEADLPRNNGDDLELAALLMQASAELDKYQEDANN